MGDGTTLPRLPGGEAGSTAADEEVFISRP
jgi:hypothetical protein